MQDLLKYYSDKGHERCGLILKDQSVVELENIHEDPGRGFEIDEVEILVYLPELHGIWHTHPNSSSVLSGADKSYMLYWPEVDHWVVGNDGIRKYRTHGEAVIDEDYIPR